MVRIAASGCLNSCVRVAVSSPSVATRATCSSSARFCAADASACLRRYIHRNAEKLWAGAVVRPHTTTPPMNPAGHAIRLLRDTPSYSPRVWAPVDRGFTGGAILGVHAIESCRKIEARVWLEAKQRRPLGHPHIVAGNIHTHMARFPASAARPIRFALSRNASFERLSSSMTTASSISGVAVTGRNAVVPSHSRRGLGQERAVPAHGSPDRLERNDQHRDADSTKAEAERRPDEQRNRI